MTVLPPLTRQLGRGMAALIPQTDTEVSAAVQAASVLAALQPVPVQLGFLQAAMLLLEGLATTTTDAATKATATETGRLLQAAMGFPSDT
ncbi:hypothetical protein ACFW9D_29325 [Streptomyces sp. NPDC059524]|uniref:hypothetical protein n=1 Tax=Streptomyces sp. NPDC059524 TaxID=3346856 RepID=UPI0036BF5B6E